MRVGRLAPGLLSSLQCAAPSAYDLEASINASAEYCFMVRRSLPPGEIVPDAELNHVRHMIILIVHKELDVCVRQLLPAPGPIPTGWRNAGILKRKFVRAGALQKQASPRGHFAGPPGIAAFKCSLGGNCCGSFSGGCSAAIFSSSQPRACCTVIYSRFKGARACERGYWLSEVPFPRLHVPLGHRLVCGCRKFARCKRTHLDLASLAFVQFVVADEPLPQPVKLV
jgi:hypothetical protein